MCDPQNIKVVESQTKQNNPNELKFVNTYTEVTKLSPNVIHNVGNPDVRVSIDGKYLRIDSIDKPIECNNAYIINDDVLITYVTDNALVLKQVYPTEHIIHTFNTVKQSPGNLLLFHKMFVDKPMPSINIFYDNVKGILVRVRIEFDAKTRGKEFIKSETISNHVFSDDYDEKYTFDQKIVDCNNEYNLRIDTRHPDIIVYESHGHTYYFYILSCKIHLCLFRDWDRDNMVEYDPLLKLRTISEFVAFNSPTPNVISEGFNGLSEC